MNPVFKRVFEAKKEAGLTWDQVAQQAKIRVSSWMTGLPNAEPTDDELRKMASVLNTTYEWLKYGKM